MARSPGATMAWTSAIAASLIACARRMHSISSAVFEILAAPSTPLASTAVRPAARIAP